MMTGTESGKTPSAEPRQDVGQRPAEPRRSRAHARARTLVAAGSWLYLAAVVFVWLTVRAAGDRWWPVTLLLFAPRWPFALPLLVLAPAAAALRRWSLGPLLAAALVVVGPLMGLCLPWGVRSGGGVGTSLRVLTCNTHFKALDPQRLARLVADARPDVVALQEWEQTNAPLVFGEGWNVLAEDEFCVASRFPIRKLGQFDLDRWGPWAIRYELTTPAGRVTFVDVHLTSPHSWLADVVRHARYGVARLRNNIARRAEEAAELRHCAADAGMPVLIAGDFNMPPDSTIFRRELSSFSDAFSSAGFGYGWTYRAKWTVVRIDHVLASEGWACRGCRVGPYVGSPHRPLIADFAAR